MDPSMQYQNQSQPYDPSSAAAYYQQYGNYQYYPQDYSNYQQQPQTEESYSVHPPGVPVEPQTQYSGNDQYYAYQKQYGAATWQGSGAGTEASQVAAHPSQYDSAMWHNGGVVPENGHVRPRPSDGPSYSGRGRRGGRGGGGSSFCGRGRGRGRGGPIQEVPPQQSAPPPRMAWCELCRCDCNTAEILQKHLEGKKHKKNLKMKEELERLNKIIVERQNEKVEETKVENVSETSASRGRGSKRKMRGGRGGNKWMRTPEGFKREVEPPNPKQAAVPFVCQLCRVTCETQVVFDSHLRGKKHMANLHEQQTLLGHAALEALYPALQAILPALLGNYPPNPDASTFSALAPQFQQDGQDTQAILTQLLTSFLATGQVGVTPGAASTSARGPPLVAENPNPENLPLQPEGASQGAADVEAKSQMQPESANSEAVPADTIEKKAETIVSETEKVDAQLALKP